MEMIRCRCKAGTHEVHEPANTDAQRAANPAQEDLLAKQALRHGAVFCVNHPVGSVHDELAATRLALVILLAIVNVAILLELQRPTFRTYVSHAHGHL